MKQRIIFKGLAVAVIVLFIGLAIQPSVAVQPETEIDIEPKDYLFQTIIDFANNPEVKELFEQYKPDLFNFDIDRSVYRKIFFRNPRLLFDTLFTKPTMIVEYLNKCYNNGIKITNIIGEDKVIEFIENVEFTDTKLLDGLDTIISKDEELSSRLATLKEMNNDLKQDAPLENYSKLCAILMCIAFAFLFPCGWCYILYQIFNENLILSKIFSSIGLITGGLFFTLGYIFGGLCYGFPPDW